VGGCGSGGRVYGGRCGGVGIVRVVLLALWWPRDDPPTEAMLRDPWFLAMLAGAAGTMLYAIYG